MSRLLAGALLFLAACAPLPREFRPLERVVQRPGGGTTVTTVGTTVLVGDASDYTEEKIDSDPLIRAVLLHERVHAERQLDQGVAEWLATYLTDKDVAWAEEQLGWYVQIRELQRLGQPVNAQGVAKILSEYAHPLGQIVEFYEALNWVNSVLSGQWHPPGNE